MNDQHGGQAMNLVYIILCAFALSGCTVKAVGDPNRPITINAHITLDIKGLKDTATDIEDYVSKPKDTKTLPANGGK